jgi:phospholipid/cholesterol/gamma-HCH transport system substrate-binding protein
MATTAEPPRGGSGRLTEDELLSALPARSANREIRVGLFVLLGVAAFLIAIFTFTDVGTFRGRYYLTTDVLNAGGMRRGDPVQMRGVNIGRVVEFGMEPGSPGVRIRMEVEDEYPVPKGSRAEVQSSGLLGGMVVNIIPSRSTETVEDGAAIPGKTAQGIFDAAATVGTRADTVLMRANALLNPTTTAAVGQSAVELQALISELNVLATEQRKQLTALTTSLRRASAEAEEAAGGVARLTTGPELQRSIEHIDSLTAQLDLTTRSLNSASTSLDSILGRMDRGEGTLGKLSRDDSLYVNLNEAVVNLKTLVADFQANPKKYINVSVF